MIFDIPEQELINLKEEIESLKKEQELVNLKDEVGSLKKEVDSLKEEVTKLSLPPVHTVAPAVTSRDYAIPEDFSCVADTECTVNFQRFIDSVAVMGGRGKALKNYHVADTIIVGRSRYNAGFNLQIGDNPTGDTKKKGWTNMTGLTYVGESGNDETPSGCKPVLYFNQTHEVVCPFLLVKQFHDQSKKRVAGIRWFQNEPGSQLGSSIYGFVGVYNCERALVIGAPETNDDCLEDSTFDTIHCRGCRHPIYIDSHAGDNIVLGARQCYLGNYTKLRPGWETVYFTKGYEATEPCIDVNEAGDIHIPKLNIAHIQGVNDSPSIRLKFGWTKLDAYIENPGRRSIDVTGWHINRNIKQISVTSDNTSFDSSKVGAIIKGNCLLFNCSFAGDVMLHKPIEAIATDFHVHEDGFRPTFKNAWGTALKDSNLGNIRWAKKDKPWEPKV